MVTVRQFSRGVGRTIRAVERDAQRAQRQRLLQAKAHAKRDLLNDSAEAAESYVRLIELLTGCHRAEVLRMDWSASASMAWPEDPLRSDERERAAAGTLGRHKPSWIAKTLGLAQKRKAKLGVAVEKARAADEDAHAEAWSEVAGRRDDITLAQSVINLDSDALVAAVSRYAKFDDVAIEAINVLAIKGRVIATVDALEIEDMPTHSIGLLQSGKASRKELSASKRLELLRDNICSSAVRVAVEFLRVLPVDDVEVVMQTDLLDRGSGHITSQPVLYARITAQALSRLNLSMADAVPLAERLGAHFDWSRKDGFRPLDLCVFDLPFELIGQDAQVRLPEKGQ